MTNSPNEPLGPGAPEPGAPEPGAPESAASTGAPSWGTPPPTGAPSWGTPPSPPPAGLGSGHGPGTGAAPGGRFFDAVRRLGIVRPDDGRWAAGVASGIARRYQVDPVVVRLAFAVLALLGGLGVTLYGLGWLLLPHPDGRIHAQQVLGGTVTAGFVGALLTVLVTAHDALPLLVVALAVFLIVRHRRNRRYRAC